MNFFKSLKLQYRPPRLRDADFGELMFMYIRNHPDRSYWECEWLFPPTQTLVSIALDGNESGPYPEFRHWHLTLPFRYVSILELARPQLALVFASWLKQDLPSDIFSVVKLSGFGVVNPTSNPVEWDISFETIGTKWLGITIPFIDAVAQQATVDT